MSTHEAMPSPDHTRTCQAQAQEPGHAHLTQSHPRCQPPDGTMTESHALSPTPTMLGPNGPCARGHVLTTPDHARSYAGIDASLVSKSNASQPPTPLSMHGSAATMALAHALTVRPRRQQHSSKQQQQPASQTTYAALHV
jgi:hypothetical protein